MAGRSGGGYRPGPERIRRVAELSVLAETCEGGSVVRSFDRSIVRSFGHSVIRSFDPGYSRVTVAEAVLVVSVREITVMVTVFPDMGKFTGAL